MGPAVSEPLRAIRDYALIGDCHGAALAQSSHLILRNATITGSDYALWVDSSAAEVYARR